MRALSFSLSPFDHHHAPPLPPPLLVLLRGLFPTASRTLFSARLSQAPHHRLTRILPARPHKLPRADHSRHRRVAARARRHLDHWLPPIDVLRPAHARGALPRALRERERAVAGAGPPVGDRRGPADGTEPPGARRRVSELSVRGRAGHVSAPVCIPHARARARFPKINTKR